MTKMKKDPREPLFSTQDKANLGWFWKNYLKKKIGLLLLILGMILVQGFVYQQFLSKTESGLRVIFDSGSLYDLALISLFVFMLFAIRGLMSYFVPIVATKISSGAVFSMRSDLVRHLMILDLAYFERTKTGEIIRRLVGQSQMLGMFVGITTANAVRDLVTVVIVSGYLIYKNPILFVSALIILPFIMWIMNHVSARVKMAQKKMEQASSAYMSNIEETVSSMRTVKIAAQEPMEIDRLTEGSGTLRELSVRMQRVQALVAPSIDLSSAVVYVMVIGGGGYMVLSPDYDVDSAGIITFLLGLVMVFDPARLLAQYFSQLQSNLVILDRMHSLYDEDSNIKDAPDAVSDFNTSGDVHLNDVVFSYHSDQPLFDGLNMTFEGGKVSAIVGATGSGKTTVLSLLSRLYDVQGGEITIGDQKIDKLQIRSLRSAFSVVAQDIVIFNNSIWENIRYVNPEATDAEIWQAAENAEIADLMRKRGDAPVGPKGAQLSGGQKQRIAIARAFLSDAPILLLDEATSALDQATEARIKTALTRLTNGCTTIVVAHRLSSIADADQIYVMESGGLIEQGTHDDLLEENGLYAQLFNAQRSSYNGKKK